MKWSEVTEYDREIIIDLWDKGWRAEDIEDEAGIGIAVIHERIFYDD